MLIYVVILIFLDFLLVLKFNGFGHSAKIARILLNISRYHASGSRERLGMTKLHIFVFGLTLTDKQIKKQRAYSN